MINKTPLYNLNAILREVNLSADVLRAWERRYQLPVPRRTAGGHRLYSQYDIETIKWLKLRMQDGLSISRAVSLWKEIASTSDPLEKLPTSPMSIMAISQRFNEAIESYRVSWVNACLDFDAATAETILNQALSMFSIEKVCIEVIQLGLRAIGDKWYSNAASAHQEHFATALAHNRVQAMIAGTPKPLFDKTILIGCPAGELHTFPGLLLNLFLRRQGFNVIYLGADIPLEQLTETVNQLNPNLVILIAQRLPSAKNLAKAASLIYSHDHPVAYGGLIFNTLPSLSTRIAGNYLGDSLEGSVEQVRNLIMNPISPVIPAEIPTELISLGKDFEEHRALIEHRVIQILREQSIEIPHLSEINVFLGDDISAGIALGSLDLVDPEITWVKNVQRGINNSSLLIAYMETYKKAVQEELGSTGDPISKWISNTYPTIKDSK
jgi:MerR family transcriptional regulator, light-induced transcriptional regulator